MRMIRVIGNMADVTGAMCVFKGGNCLRQLDFLQFPPTGVSLDRVGHQPVVRCSTRRFECPRVDRNNHQCRACHHDEREMQQADRKLE